MDWSGLGWKQFVDLFNPVMNILVPQYWGKISSLYEKLSFLCSAVDYSVHKYTHTHTCIYIYIYIYICIYIYCMSGPSNITLL